MEARAPTSGNATALIVATVAFAACFFAWSLLGPLGPDLQDELGLSDLELSVMVSVPVLLGSLARIPLGILSDRHGARPVFTLLMAWTLLPLIALAVAHDSYAVVIVLGFLLGFAGASFAVGVPFVSRWYPLERQGSALGIYGIGMGGTTLAALIAPTIADEWGLAAPFWVAAGLVAVVAVVFFLVARDAPGSPARSGSLLAPLAVFRGNSRAWGLTLFYFLSFGGFVAMFLYLPTLLTTVHDLSKTDAGARAAGFALLAVVGRPLGGLLSDRIGAARVLRISFIATAVLALALALAYESMVPLTIACLSVAMAFGLGMGATFKLVPSWFPAQVGAVTGVVGAAGGLGGFFPPLVMGIVKEATGGYALGFVLLAIVAVLCLLLLNRLGRGATEPEPAAAGAAAERPGATAAQVEAIPRVRER
jgi:NNP family nitrate/nitrite transporter-like MFS transporter